jgi:hypothetical protein
MEPALLLAGDIFKLASRLVKLKLEKKGSRSTGFEE